MDSLSFKKLSQSQFKNQTSRFITNVIIFIVLLFNLLHGGHRAVLGDVFDLGGGCTCVTGREFGKGSPQEGMSRTWWGGDRGRQVPPKRGQWARRGNSQ